MGSKRSATGLLSEAVKKTRKAAADMAKMVAGKQSAGKSPAGNLSESAHKAGRAVADTARRAVGLRPTRVKKSGT